MSLLLSRNALRPRVAQRVFVQARGAAHFENTVYNSTHPRGSLTVLG